MNNSKIRFFTLLFSASVFFLSLLFSLPKVATAKELAESASDVSRPWDVMLTFCYGKQTYQYTLSASLDGLDEIELKNRLIYRSATAKAKWLKTKQKQGVELEWATCYIFPQLDLLFSKMRSQIEFAPVDSLITFSPDSAKKFTYTDSSEGIRINFKKTCQSLLNLLSQGERKVVAKISTDTLLPVTSLSDAKKSTTMRGRFVTDCSNSSKNRINNLRLSLSFFNGLIVEQNQTVSFNQTVGKRTAERGFSVAKVLQNGKYVDGVGGGVCQASTTLFNALLKADVAIRGVCQHSVKSSYVSPSFDAMVTDNGADLIFQNTTDGRLYICAHVKDGKVSVEIYGMPNPYEITCRTTILENIPYATTTVIDNDKQYADKVTYCDETHLLTAGVEGVVSEGWLDYKQNGKTVFSKKIRTNHYNPIDCVIIRGALSRPEDKS